ncbi:MAG: [protein-PII] uridylyltransferase, partial [Gemmobacter sp.]
MPEDGRGVDATMTAALPDVAGLCRAIRADIAALPADAPPTARRAAAVGHLVAARAAGMAALEAGFAGTPEAAPGLIGAISTLTDRIVIAAFEAAGVIAGEAHGAVALIAVGGCGRAEMAPHSDVDLLFLTGPRPAPALAQRVEAMLYILWDLRLKVGHATRTIAECVRQAREDVTVRTALLEHRALMGDGDLIEGLRRSLRQEVYAGSAAQFIEAKLTERAERHSRQGG